MLYIPESLGSTGLKCKFILPDDHPIGATDIFSCSLRLSFHYIFNNSKSMREDIRNVDIARRILHRQRMSVKVFAGNRRPAKDEILDVSQRLYKDTRDCLLRKSLNLPPVTQTHYATDDVRDVVDTFL
jgi:hypothetical protein